MWRGEEIAKSNFSARYIGSNATGKMYEFRGDFAQRKKNNKRGSQGNIYGRFEIANNKSMLTSFRAYALRCKRGEPVDSLQAHRQAHSRWWCA